MYRITRTSATCVTAATVALILLTSATLTTSVYAARHHHGHRSIEDGYQTYGLSDQANNGNGNNPVGNQVNAPPVSDQANNGNGNNPVGKAQILSHTPTIAYKSPTSNDMLMSFANSSQPLCAAGICSQSYTKH